MSPRQPGDYHPNMSSPGNEDAARIDRADASRQASSASSLSLILRALRHRNYRLFYIGQSISLIGTWITRIATSWLVYRLTNSAFLLGFVAFASQIPMLLIAPFAGVLVDRANRRRILVITQILSLLQSLALAGLTFFHIIDIYQIVALCVLQGLINALDNPARQAFVVEMVDDRADLANAIALNSSMVNAARLIGPSIAGLLIAAWGEALCFLIDAISYLAVVFSLLLMRLQPLPPATQQDGHLHAFREGIRYSFGFPPIRSILLLTAVISIMGMSYAVLMPLFATGIFHGGPRTLGFLMGASGCGALAGALYLASRRSVLGLGRIIPVAAALCGLALVAFGASRIYWLSMVTLFIAGGAMITNFASANTLIQTIVDDSKRGRVMSLFGVAFLGMVPIGALLAGSLATCVGPALTVQLTGAVCILAAIVFARQLPTFRKLLHPIYVRKGILPPAAAEVQLPAPD